MIEISSQVSATLTLGRDRDFRFFDLPKVVGTVFDQVDIRIERLDLACKGNSIEYVTDQGNVVIEHAVDARGTATLRIVCDTLRRGSREVGRQICFQIVQRFIARYCVATVHWLPTRQTMPPGDFRWSVLADLPQRFAPRALPVAAVRFDPAAA